MCRSAIFLSLLMLWMPVSTLQANDLCGFRNTAESLTIIHDKTSVVQADGGEGDEQPPKPEPEPEPDCD